VFGAASPTALDQDRQGIVKVCVPAIGEASNISRRASIIVYSGRAERSGDRAGWLEDHGIRQPFRQAHREIYVLTDAERTTRTYSNRFAAHILRQHQFAALCEEREWKFRLMGQWDSHNTPTLELPWCGLRVKYGVDFPVDESGVSGHFIYLLIRTDKVAFLDESNVPRELT